MNSEEEAFAAAKAILRRTPSQPSGGMGERAKAFLERSGIDHVPTEFAPLLASEFTLIRQEAIEDAAMAADREVQYWSRMMEGKMPSAMLEQITQRWAVANNIAAAIRGMWGA